MLDLDGLLLRQQKEQLQSKLPRSSTHTQKRTVADHRSCCLTSYQFLRIPAYTLKLSSFLFGDSILKGCGKPLTRGHHHSRSVEEPCSRHTYRTDGKASEWCPHQLLRALCVSRVPGSCRVNKVLRLHPHTYILRVCLHLILANVQTIHFQHQFISYQINNNNYQKLE